MEHPLTSRHFLSTAYAQLDNNYYEEAVFGGGFEEGAAGADLGVTDEAGRVMLSTVRSPVLAVTSLATALVPVAIRVRVCWGPEGSLT